ncbi:OmpA family protein [Burkholderia ubonensis]|uniref:OmpA family protein n=2 Tax=Burkholderia ubonensis TaxID=101571 RepID=UPI0009B31FA7|nr:OmpA family protein [Burkholderia ubonensis]
MTIGMPGIARMVKLISTAALPALVAGCTATSGLTYDARAKDLSGKAGYEVECRGLFETLHSCIDTAKRICLGKRVKPVDSVTGAPSVFDGLASARTITFLCEDETATEKVRTASLMPIATIPLRTDILFGFDQSDLASITPIGRIELQKVAVDINKAVSEQLIISGYTDRLGDDAYNLKLSARRAESIKQFLLESGVRVPILARGYGKRVPGTPCSMHERAALIDCLAPDRVVELTIMARPSNAP